MENRNEIKEAKKEVLKQFIEACLEVRDKDNWKKEHQFTIHELIEIAEKLGVECDFIIDENISLS